MRHDPVYLPAVHPGHSSPAPPFASFHAQADSNMKPETLERKSIPTEHPPLLNVTKEVDIDPSTPFLHSHSPDASEVLRSNFRARCPSMASKTRHTRTVLRS